VGVPRYKPLGELRYVWGPTMTSLCYTGQRLEGTGLYDYGGGTRWYDPSLGRFVQADSVTPLASQEVQAWDRYAGMNNNPVRYNDPIGPAPTTGTQSLISSDIIAAGLDITSHTTTLGPVVANGYPGTTPPPVTGTLAVAGAITSGASDYVRHRDYPQGYRLAHAFVVGSESAASSYLSNAVGLAVASPFAAANSPMSPITIGAYFSGYSIAYSSIIQGLNTINQQHIEPLLMEWFPIPVCSVPR